MLCDYLLTALVSYSPLPRAAEFAAVIEGVTTVVFLWLAFARDRWWLIAAAAALVLCSLTGLLGFVHPDVTLYAAASAQIGLWMIVYLALLAGVCERWLAGETPGAVAGRQPHRKTT